MVSNGPYVLSEWKPQEKVVVVKNDKYWDAKNVALKKITFIANDDINVGYNLYKSGAADWTGLSRAVSSPSFLTV